MVKKNFTRKNFSNKIYQNLGFSKNYSSTIIDNFFETLIQELIKSHKIKISSFGTFSVRSKGQRIGRNPKTGKEVQILPRRVLVFRPSQILKDKVNQGS